MSPDCPYSRRFDFAVLGIPSISILFLSSRVYRIIRLDLVSWPSMDIIVAAIILQVLDLVAEVPICSVMVSEYLVDVGAILATLARMF